MEEKHKYVGLVNCILEENAPCDFYTLSVWGKPCFVYACETLAQINCLNERYVVTDSAKIAHLAEKQNYRVLSEKPVPHDDTTYVEISGRALFLKPQTIQSCVISHSGGVLFTVEQQKTFALSDYARMTPVSTPVISNAMVIYSKNNSNRICYQPLPMEESLVINTVNDFELALVLKKKQMNRSLLTESILKRIEEKKSVFEVKSQHNSICLVGHSQLDFWNISSLCGYDVRNCGIAGISSVEYRDYILNRNLLSCGSPIYVVMHGTNDIVYPYSDEQIIENISSTFQYILQYNPAAKLFFLLVANTNGRLDRSNKRINQLNIKLKTAFTDVVTVIDIQELNDEFGDLKSDYTIDGLHFSSAGYERLQQIVENAIRKSL